MAGTTRIKAARGTPGSICGEPLGEIAGRSVPEKIMIPNGPGATPCAASGLGGPGAGTPAMKMLATRHVTAAHVDKFRLISRNCAAEEVATWTSPLTRLPAIRRSTFWYSVRGNRT